MWLHCVWWFLISHQLSRADTPHLLWPGEQSSAFWQVRRRDILVAGMGIFPSSFFPSQLLGWPLQLMGRFWAPTICSGFCCFQLVQYSQIQPLIANFASPATVKRTSRDTNSGLCLFFRINIMMQINTTWLCPLFPMANRDNHAAGFGMKWTGRYQHEVGHPACRPSLGILVGIKPHLHFMIFILHDPKLQVGSKPSCIQRRKGQEEILSLFKKLGWCSVVSAQGSNEEHHFACGNLHQEHP